MCVCVRVSVCEYVHAYVRECVRACVRECVRACVHACMCSNYTTRMHSKGLSNRIVCLSVCLSMDKKNIENTNNQLKYAVIRYEKGTITTFDLCQLQIQSFLISYYSSPTPPL